MYNRLDIEWTIAREKQRDLLRQVEQYRLVRLARAGNRTRVKAGPRAWDRLACWLRPLRLGRGADRTWTADVQTVGFELRCLAAVDVDLDELARRAA